MKNNVNGEPHVPTNAEITAAAIEAGKEAKKNFRDVFLGVAEESGLSAQSLVDTLMSCLKATTVKAHYEKDVGFEYSQAMIDHATRLNAVKVAGEFFGLKASEKHELTGAEGGPIEVCATVNIIRKPKDESAADSQ